MPCFLSSCTPPSRLIFQLFNTGDLTQLKLFGIDLEIRSKLLWQWSVAQCKLSAPGSTRPFHTEWVHLGKFWREKKKSKGHAFVSRMYFPDTIINRLSKLQRFLFDSSEGTLQAARTTPTQSASPSTSKLLSESIWRPSTASSLVDFWTLL